MKRIGIDIDGCLTDVYSWYFKNGSEYAKTVGKGLVNENGCDAKEMYDLTDDEFKNFLEKKLLDYSMNEPVREGASDTCIQLISEGFELYIITARFNSDKDNEEGLKMRKIVEKWLKDNKIPYSKIIYSSENKKDICLENHIEIMIEDNLKTLKEIKKYIPVICFDAPYNRNIDNDNLIRVTKWEEILNYITKKYENNKTIYR